MVKNKKTLKDIKELIPEEYRKASLHRVSLQNDVFENLKRLRRRDRLWDTSDAIKYALKKCGEWEEPNKEEKKKR